MAITYHDTAKQAALNGIVDLIDGGSGDSTGDFVVKSSGGTVLATMTFSSTAFGSASINGSNAEATSNTITDSGTPTAGTIASGAFRNKANTEILAFSMGTSGADMIISDVTITSAYTAVGCSGVTVMLALA